MRSIGLDIHRDFAEVAIAEGGELRSAGRIEMTPEALELFARSLGLDDRVALEVSGNAWEVARIIRPHVARVVAVSPADTGIRAARAKTDRLDARALAKLRAAGPTRWGLGPGRGARAMRRRLGRRAAERFRTRLTTADVSPVEARPLIAAREPPAPPVAASSDSAGEPQLRVVSRLREAAKRAVQRRCRCRRDRRVDREVEPVDLAPHPAGFVSADWSGGEVMTAELSRGLLHLLVRAEQDEGADDVGTDAISAQMPAKTSRT